MCILFRWETENCRFELKSVMGGLTRPSIGT
jgi:hypothetical protein